MQQQRDQLMPRISAVQCGMLVAGTTSITNHALAVTYLLQAGGRDAWLSGLIAAPLAFLAMAALVGLSRSFPRLSIIEYLPRLLGGVLGRVVGLAYIIYFLLAAIFTLRRTTDWLVDSLLPETPPWLIASLYLLACLYLALGGIEPLARMNQFTLVSLTILGMFISTMTMPQKDYGLLRPIMEHGPLPALLAGLVALGILGELCVLSMFVHYAPPTSRTLKATLVGVLYAVVTMTGPVSGSIAALGHRQSSNMPYPTFQQWLLISFARFFERTDLLAVHQWLVGAYVRLGLFLYAAGLGLGQLTGSKRWRPLAAVSAVAVIISSLALFRNTISFDAFIVFIYFPAGGLMGILLPLLLWSLAAVRGMLRRGNAPYGQGPAA